MRLLMLRTRVADARTRHGRRALLWLIAAGLSCGGTLARAQGATDELLGRIAAQLGQDPGIRADFAQTQNMAAFKAPRTASGKFLLLTRGSVLWQVHSPYQAAWVIGGAGVLELDATGKPVGSLKSQVVTV
ncbi:MAG: hypothetical protein MO853_06675 [Candidatus Protistobacter heckmanni]|nr:hypothetical protein [Candidatus Protistobacter heckmanni]